MSLNELQSRAKRNEPLSKHTTARIGGPADLLIEVRTTDELIAVAQRADEMGLPYLVLGGGANVLVSDAGVRGLVIINRAREVKFNLRGGRARVEVDSGVMLTTLARDCIERGLAGMEWAVSVPGTVGGGVIGNAGAHGADIASNLNLVRVMRRGQPPEYWTPRQLQFGYRTSALKRYAPANRPIVLSATFDLKLDYRGNLERRANEFIAKRKATQPSGASIGSMFKNPEGDYAGRLIEACGLKGKRIGGAMISDKHANFFINASGDARASDVKALIDLAHDAVLQRFGVDLELEIELVGEWSAAALGAGKLRGGSQASEIEHE
ncbi:MAG: UDP-N-acetylmuramate dehydrogenase [Chloroflexi bacterium]|jgi:UDP-N-acetylmuramate dehydrogenase|uniref:UDP-N-acetylenolpyruvoylglucosamine reductase n=1 Tax=Candidatus Thermofonsia Clade 3 bacterium TaxID=2364212 RepID=A0A2M8QDF6_9CHLR|nr:UDP-N-acetylmuramate dehydrogenase [Candidatus Roseilinea sp. NK_OTU-006]PJF47834.1 MAG: UDP-N-acetylenolpyruvoylglucosamine reductase [Candidatus Thermofonsia Clade 3 bacterium]RMG63576.1 MAG: UDP-N-acetylmuramate dehydrogenase [Chloroflexota bacterium]